MSERLWQVTANVVYPTHLPVEIDSNGQPQFPTQLQPQPRIPQAHGEIDDASVYLREGDKEQIPGVSGDFRVSADTVPSFHRDFAEMSESSTIS